MNQLGIPKGLIHKLLVKAFHGVCLAGHSGINKNTDILKEQFY